MLNVSPGTTPADGKAQGTMYPNFSTTRAAFVKLCYALFDSIAHDVFACSGDDAIATEDAKDFLYSQLEQYPEWRALDFDDQLLLLSEWADDVGEYLYA